MPRDINDKIDEHFQRWCEKLPGAALEDAGASSESPNNEYLNSWEDCAFWDPRKIADDVSIHDPDLTAESVGKFQAMILWANMLRSPDTYLIDTPLERRADRLEREGTDCPRPYLVQPNAWHPR